MAYKNTWVTAHYLGMKIKGLLRKVEQGNACVVTYLGEITLPYSQIIHEPDYDNPELFSKLSNNYAAFKAWDSIGA